MKRRYFLSDDLDELDRLQQALIDAGLATPQIHVLSRDDAGVEQREHLTPVEAVLRKDVVRGTEMGAVAGILGAGLVLGVAHASGVTAAVGWVPFVFLAIVVLGFCTWEGGLFGIQEPHSEFSRFSDALAGGSHLLLVDVTAREEEILDKLVSWHTGVRPAGDGYAAPEVVLRAHKKFKDVMQTLP